MGSEALLQQACELAFAVAREDAESEPSIEPPGDMRSFLYLARLPRRAISVAQQAIEEDSEFRARVASRASEESVGRAGYLWLSRPIGWAPEFEELTREVEDDTEESAGDSKPSDEIRIATVSPIRTGGTSGDTSIDVGRSRPGGFSLTAVGASGGDEDSNDDYEADAIENELTSLRGLVDKLAGERELVLAGSNAEEAPLSPHEREDELRALRSDLEAVRHELALSQSDLAIARQEREDARRQQSDALKKQVDLERQLNLVREERASIESQSSDAHVSLMAMEDRAKRAEGSSEVFERERNQLKNQVEDLSQERIQLREERASLKAERDDLSVRLDEIREKTGGVDIGELTSSNRSLTQELEATSRELARMMSQVDSQAEQLVGFNQQVDNLRAERNGLSSQLANAELSLETTRTKYEALKADTERLAAEVGSLRAERDSLQTQLSDLQESLSDVLGEQAESRARNDADRKALNELRVERDVLLARMNDIEQADRNYESRIQSLVDELDELAAIRDDLINERGQLRGEAAAASSTRSQLQAKLIELEDKISPMEVELQSERRQREELAARLLQLDEIAAENQRELESAVADRNELAEKAMRLQQERDEAGEAAVERDSLREKLSALQDRLDEETSQLRQVLSEANERVGALDTENTSLEQRLAESQSELAGVRNEHDEVSRNYSRIKVELDRERAQIKSSLAETDRRNQELEARIVELEKERNGFSENLAEVERRVEEAERRRSDAERQRDRSEERRVDAERRRAEIEQLYNDSLETRGRLESERTKSDEARHEAERALAETEARLTARQKEFSRREDELVARESSLGARETSLRARESELERVPRSSSFAGLSDTSVSTDADAIGHDDAAVVGTGRSSRFGWEGLNADDVEADSTDAEDEWHALADADGHEPTDSAEHTDHAGRTDEVDEIEAGEEPTDENQDRNLETSAHETDVDHDDLFSDSDDHDVDDRYSDDQYSDDHGEGDSVEADSVDADSVDADSEVDEWDRIVADDHTGRHEFDLDRMDASSDAPRDDARVLDMDDHRAPSIVDDPAAPTGEDDLDEISALISATVTGFDSDDVEHADRVDPGVAAGVGSIGSPPPSLFESEADKQNDWGDDNAWPESEGRRRIDIPSEIYDDEMAVAQYVISSPDLVLLVDGDSVASLGWPSLPVSQQREALVTYLAGLAATSGANPDVVFDGRISDGESLPESPMMRIRLSKPSTAPTAALNELVTAYPDQWPIALVTDDEQLAASAMSRGATVLNNGQLLDLFIAQ